MAENDMDSGQASGTAGSPTSQGSAGNGASNSSLDVAKLQSLIEGFGKRIEEIDARTKSLQGDKDRAVVKTRKEVEELKAKIAEYEKLKSKGLEPDEALDEMDFRASVRQIQEQLGKLNSVQSSPAGNGQGKTTEAAQAVIDELKLDANAPEVVSILAKGLDSDRQELELRRHAARPRPTSDAAGSSSLASRSTASPDKAAQIEQGYLEEIAKVPRGNIQMAAKVKSKWRKKAAEVGLQLNV